MKEGKVKINWFPGHMKKTLDELKKDLEKADAIIYVLDARAPKSCINPELDKLTQNKPILFVLNKIDLSDVERLEKVVSNFKGEGKDFVYLNATESGATNIICNKIKSLCKQKVKKFEEKGIKPVLRVLVVGVPNCGKSTLVNNLCKKAKAVTGDRPGVTKNKQWFSIGNNIEVCDTPGTLYPNLANQEVAKTLAFIGSIKDEIVDEVDLAREFLIRLKKLYPNVLETRYKNASNLEEIAKVRAFLATGGDLDLERTAKAVLTDFRSGKLGSLLIEE